jgi:hypothetical protein
METRKPAVVVDDNTSRYCTRGQCDLCPGTTGETLSGIVIETPNVPCACDCHWSEPEEE